VLQTHPQIQQPQEQPLLGGAKASKVRLEICLSFVVGPFDTPPSRMSALVVSVFLRIMAVTRVFLGMPSSLLSLSSLSLLAAAVPGELMARLLSSQLLSSSPPSSSSSPSSGKSLPSDTTAAFAAPPRLQLPPHPPPTHMLTPASPRHWSSGTSCQDSGHRRTPSTRWCRRMSR
jgi:hypothetical protein